MLLLQHQQLIVIGVEKLQITIKIDELIIKLSSEESQRQAKKIVWLNDIETNLNRSAK